MEAEREVVSLHDMRSGEEGIVVEIRGGHGFGRRIQSMGIRPGKRIKKISAQFLWGPVTVKVGNTVLAIGCGMSRKVFVKRGNK